MHAPYALAAAKNQQVAIRAEIVCDDRCVALGIEAQEAAPVLTLCRLLLAAGHDPNRPLHAYRNDVLALKVRAIGEAAQLEINGDGTGFRRRRGPDARPPMRKSGRAGIGHRPSRKAVP